MNNRKFDRVPASFEVEFRKASSLLVCYSVNISRGGIFLATDSLLEVGTPVSLDLKVPGTGMVTLKGHVTWHREQNNDLGPRGMGVQFKTLDHSLSQFVDHLVANYIGIHCLVMSADEDDSKTLERMLQSIVGTADVTIVKNSNSAEKLLSEAIDLVIVDIDDDEDEAWTLIAAADNHASQVPVISLASRAEWTKKALALGAKEGVGNPPQFDELRVAVLRLLGQPQSILADT